MANNKLPLLIRLSRKHPKITENDDATAGRPRPYRFLHCDWLQPRATSQKNERVDFWLQSHHSHNSEQRLKACSRHMNWTQLNSSSWTDLNRLHVFRTRWAPTVPVSLQPIMSCCWRAWPMNASCNWVDLLQDSFSSVNVLWTNLKLLDSFTAHELNWTDLNTIRPSCTTYTLFCATVGRILTDTAHRAAVCGSRASCGMSWRGCASSQFEATGRRNRNWCNQLLLFI